MSRPRTPAPDLDKRAKRYLVATLFGAAYAANAHRPFFRRRRASGLAFAPGLLGSELPYQDIALKGLLAGTAIARGATKKPAGKLGLGIAAASSAVLVGLHREAERAGGVLERALVDALGDDYREAIAELLHADDQAPITRREIALPAIYRSHRRRLVAHTDVPYGEHGWRNTLDIWRPADLPADAKAPVLLQVHGGAWMLGQKAQQATPLLARMTDHGWVCVDINYRLSPRSTWPDHIVDVKQAIAWVKDNIAAHGGDPDLVIITGGSAGGHLSSLAALSPNEKAFQPGFEDKDTTVQGCVPMYGVYDWTNRDGTGFVHMEGFLARQVLKSELAEDRERWEQASSMSWVNADAPPFFIIHGTNDSLVPIEQARSFAGMLRAASNQPVAFAELPRAQHAFDAFGSVRALHTVRAIERFLVTLQVRHRRGADEPQGDATPAPADEPTPAADASEASLTD
jgi:acetyl esterase/lipase